eukprot:4446254-Amphidinium_carterae.1
MQLGTLVIKVTVGQLLATLTGIFLDLRLWPSTAGNGDQVGTSADASSLPASSRCLSCIRDSACPSAVRSYSPHAKLLLPALCALSSAQNFHILGMPGVFRNVLCAQKLNKHTYQ